MSAITSEGHSAPPMELAFYCGYLGFGVPVDFGLGLGATFGAVGTSRIPEYFVQLLPPSVQVPSTRSDARVSAFAGIPFAITSTCSASRAPRMSMLTACQAWKLPAFPAQALPSFTFIGSFPIVVTFTFVTSRGVPDGTQNKIGLRESAATDLDV